MTCRSGSWLIKLVLVIAITANSAVLAQAPQNDPANDDTSIKTLAPLSETPLETQEKDAPAPRTNLTYTPTKDTDGPSSGIQFSPASENTPLKPDAIAAANQSLAQATSPSPEASGKSSAGNQAIAQSADSLALHLIDPANKRLPTNSGTVQIRKQFKLFIKEELIHHISFRDTPIREVIAEIGRRGNLNLVIDKSVVGKITGDLHDITLNEAMDSVLASAGLQSRVLENNTVIIASRNTMVRLGLNRPMAKVFKLSYSSPYEVANLLFASVFNRGSTADFVANQKNRLVNTSKESPNVQESEATESMQRGQDGGGDRASKGTKTTTSTYVSVDDNEAGEEVTNVSRVDAARSLKGLTRTQTQEGSGFNNAATDPGSQQIRSYQEVSVDYSVDQNGGGAIVIPDTKNRQVIVVGTPEDIAVADECIHLIDKRPRQIHIQSSLIELTNEGIRELGANINLQSKGLSGSAMGGPDQTNVGGAPLIAPLPGRPTGVVGMPLPAVARSVAGIQPSQFAQSGLNFLTLAKDAGGAANIATFPTAINVTLNLILQTNKGKLLANPSVVVSDNTEALITIADEVVHKITSTTSLGVVSTNVELTKAGVFLNVMPRTTEDGFITMRLRPQVSAPLGPPLEFGTGASPTVVTLLSVREIMSQEVRVKDGQTLVIGGLFSEHEVANLAKIPYLAEAPVLGALFRNSLKGRSRSELLLLITPKVVEEQPPATLTDNSQPTAM